MLFDRVVLIGCGLIGSSLGHAIKLHRLAGHLTVVECPELLARVAALSFSDTVTDDAIDACTHADLVIIATPMSSYAAIMQQIGPILRPGAVLTDVGSVKQAAHVIMAQHIAPGVYLMPGHPIAGTEFSGPEAGFAALFQDRWCILTPSDVQQPGNDAAQEKLSRLWRACGARVTTMTPAHHDRVLAMTSHLPHLIAYAMVGTCVTLEQTLQQEVMAYSASGFRDFTRIAASDPTMWRDIFLTNRDAVLDGLALFMQDLTQLQNAIAVGDGDGLFDILQRISHARRGLITT